MIKKPDRNTAAEDSWRQKTKPLELIAEKANCQKVKMSITVSK